MHALGVEFAQHIEAGLENRRASFGVAGGEEGGDVFGGRGVSAAGVEISGDLGEFGAGPVQRRRAGGMREFILRKSHEEVARGRVKGAKGFEIESINRRHAVEKLFTRGAGFLLADVRERRGGDDADGGRLPGLHRETERCHAGGTDEHDGRDGDDKDQGCDQPAAFHELQRRRIRGGRRGSAGAEAADEEFPLVFDGH